MVDVSLEQVLACLWEFPKASAPGASEWRAQHILELVTGPASTSVHTHLEHSYAALPCCRSTSPMPSTALTEHTF